MPIYYSFIPPSPFQVEVLREGGREEGREGGGKGGREEGRKGGRREGR